MKYINKLLIIVMISMLFITGCGKKSGYTEISFDTLEKMVTEKQTFVLFIGKATCSACNMYKEILNNQFAKEHGDVTIYYIDLNNLSDDQAATFNSQFDYSATPTTVVVTAGKVSNTDKVVGSDCYNDLIKLLKRKGIIEG